MAGGLETQVLYGRLVDLETPTRDYFRFYYKASDENVSRPFTLYDDAGRDAVVVDVGRYSFDEVGFDLGSGAQRRFAASIAFRTGDFYDGTHRRASGEVNWKPSRRFNLTYRYSWDNIDLPSGEFTSRLFSVGTEVAIRLNLTWVNLLQYDNSSENFGINSRLHWIPKAGREGFIVINRSVTDPDKDNHFDPALTDLNVKFSYTFRF